MKSIILFLLAILHVFQLSSQNKQDYYWPHGKDQNLEMDGVQAIELDFNQRPFSAKERGGELQMGQNNASVCDKDGNLLFYTNGCAVANRHHQIMSNGDSINAGKHFTEWWGGDCRRGYPGGQNIIILDDPGMEGGFYIIHKIFSYNPEEPSENRFPIDSLLYTYVDLAGDGGDGEVVIKNRTFYNGSLMSAYLTAIKKENGIDWWVLDVERPNKFNLFSLSDKGLELSHQIEGPTYSRYASSRGWARFSPDGNKYVYYNEWDGLYLYDFDRRAGTLSNEEFLHIEQSENPWFASCEWSPSSRYLYVTKKDTIWQLDTTVEPLDDGLVFIAEKLRIEGGDETTPGFDIAALGPDCRIYLRDKSGSLTFHVINKPDEAGTACDFVQEGLRLPTYSAAGSFPNFPRFRVDDEEKCDPSIVSIVGEAVWWRRDLHVYPNPSRGPINIELPDGHQKGRLYAVNMQGRVVLDNQIEQLSGETTLDLSHLPEGIYSVEFLPEDNKERIVWTQKVSVTK